MAEAVAGAAGAIATWWGSLSAVEAAYVVLAAASVAYSAYSAVEASNQAGQDLESSGHLGNTKTSDAPLPLIYGRCRVGCNVPFASTTGAKNYKLHLICTLGEGPIDAVEQIYLDGKPIESYSGLSYYYEVFLGTADQAACSTLHGAIPAFNDPMRHTAYLYLALVWDKDGMFWQRIPNVTARVRGLKVYDPDSGTFAWSGNPALAVYDMMTRPSTRGGLGLDAYRGPVPASPRIDPATVVDTAQYCAAKGWTCNMPITIDQAWIDNLALVLPLFRGDLVYSETVFKLLFRDLNHESIVMTLDEKDVVREGDRSSLRIRQPDIWDRPNTLRVKYLDANGDPEGWGSYQSVDYLHVDAAALAADGDTREMEAKLYGLSGLPAVQGMANYILERARSTRRIPVLLRSRALALEPGDLIQLSHGFPGWTGKKLRLESGDVIPGSLHVACELIEEATSLYDDDYDAEDPEFYDTTLPSPADAVPSVRDVSLSEEQYYYRDKRYTRLKVDFSPPDPEAFPFFDYAEVYVSVGGTADFRYITRCDGNYVIDPVEIGEIYYVKLRAVSLWGSRENYDNAPVFSRTINGYTTAPSDMEGITPAVVDDSVYVRGVEVADAGIRGYEFRISGQENSSWAGATYLAFNRMPVWQMTGMRAGDFRIWCSPQDDAGQYSDAPVYADFTVGVPHGHSLLATEDIDHGDIGDSFSNTEMYDEGGGQYALRCSHAAGVLSGTYTSREIDLGSVQTVRAQGDFLAKVLNSSVTYAALWGPTGTFDVVDLAATFGAIYGISNPSQISAKLQWGDTSGVYPHEQELFQLMAVTATGRYFRVVVTITDPHDAQYGLLVGADADTVLTLTFFG